MTFPLLLDTSAEGYMVSNSYGLTHVPSIFVVETDGTITQTLIGFSRAEFEDLASLAGAAAFRSEDKPPVWKPG